MLGSRTAFRKLKKHIVNRCRQKGLRTNLEYLKFYAPGFFDGKRKGRCDSLFGRHLAINTKGNIMPCCRYWGVHLGSLGDLPFAEAWNGKSARAWREDMLQGRYPDGCLNFCGYPSKES